MIDAIARRTVDVVVSLLALVVLAPVMAVIAVFIKRDSDGPVVFAQTRVGRRGRDFTLLKFRTMTSAVSVTAPQVTAGGDARVTQVGRRLRSTKLDELPQLVNVLRADMSFVGPRPEVPRYAAHWTSQQREVILSVRPGITDPVTIELRREEEILAEVADPETYYVDVLLPEKAQKYVEYVQTRTLASDFALLVRTLWAIVAR